MLSFRRGMKIAEMTNPTHFVRFFDDNMDEDPDIVYDGSVDEVIPRESVIAYIRVKHLHKQHFLKLFHSNVTYETLQGARNQSETLHHLFLFVRNYFQKNIRIPLRDDSQIFPLFYDRGDQFNHHLCAFGNTGSGKSTAVAYMLQKDEKRRPIVVFTRHVEDKSLRPISELRRTRMVDVTDEKAANETLESLEGCNVVMDDIEQIMNQKMREHLIEFRKNIIENGRHFGIQGFFTCHNPFKRQITLPLVNGCRRFILFPKQNKHMTDLLLEQKFHLPLHKRTEILDMGKHSHWILYNNFHPCYVLSRKHIMLV